LSVSEDGGKVLVHCGANCSQDAVLDALRERGLWETRAERRRNGRSNGRNNIVATYTYRDEGGIALFEVCRTANKAFPQRRPGASEWGIEGVRRVLYRLPELLAADPTEIVYICEGEKDADRLAALGFVSTTSPMGAGNWRSEYADFLRGRKVIIPPDNDADGRKYAQDVAASLHGVAADVRILELPELPERGDVSDWLAAGGSVDKLRELAEVAPVWEREPIPGGAELLDDIVQIVVSYVVLTREQADATALWLLHTYAIDAADATPYLHVTSPEKRSGKTRLLEVLDLLAARPWFTGRVTAAVLQRRLERDHPSLLLDETDAAFKKESEYSEALRAILNAGHRRGCKAWLCVKKGGDIELVGFDVFGPKALAGIGKLPETVADRSIKIVLRRRAPSEPVTRFRRREVEEEARPIRERLERWAAANVEALRALRPHIPDYIDDRAIDGWEPLFAIADAAGGDWPQRSRMVALALSHVDVRDDESVGVRLLADIQALFHARPADRLPTAELLTALNALDESPWGDWSGKPLTPRGLARLLRPFAIKPGTIRLADGQTPKGYVAGDFADAWGRYLPSLENPPQAPQAPQTPDSDSADVADVADVAVTTGIGEEVRCHVCGGIEFYYRADGTGPVCARCHPNPEVLAEAWRRDKGVDHD
jgi:hypothetical protein